uniref:Enoyl-CoA hydratase, mitochondrial n=1 Tax=Anolis carolinensis TaxID=28377 RepID=A0A803TWC5_ANOCA
MAAVRMLVLRSGLAGLRPWAASSARFMSSSPSFQFVEVERRGAEGSVAVVALNRPKALNALSEALMSELGQALDAAEREASVGALVLTRRERAFAAGDFLANWDRLARVRKPVVAAVNGLALGEGSPALSSCFKAGMSKPWALKGKRPQAVRNGGS